MNTSKTIGKWYYWPRGNASSEDVGLEESQETLFDLDLFSIF